MAIEQAAEFAVGADPGDAAELAVVVEPQPSRHRAERLRAHHARQVIEVELGLGRKRRIKNERDIFALNGAELNIDDGIHGIGKVAAQD